jgi:hypothetical protein
MRANRFPLPCDIPLFCSQVKISALVGISTAEVLLALMQQNMVAYSTKLSIKYFNQGCHIINNT